MLLDPHARAARLEDAGDAALKYKLDRNKYNKKYRARRALVKNIAEHKKKQKELLRNSSLVTKALNAPRRAAVKAMKEDWALGPLAPKRDIGELEGQLGTISLNQANLPEPTDAQVNQRWKMMGMNKFKEQDRVVVTQGRDRGKIGQIVLIDEVKMTCAIDGINRVSLSFFAIDMEVNADMMKSSPSASPHSCAKTILDLRVSSVATSHCTT